jgi:hypothetical protein
VILLMREDGRRPDVESLSHKEARLLETLREATGAAKEISARERPVCHVVLLDQ